MTPITQARRASLQRFILALREADAEAFRDGDWARLNEIRLCLDDAREELKAL